ncbi:MAG TPA: heparinase II/III family protein, partial [Gemmatimonadaceae bacterium]
TYGARGLRRRALHETRRTVGGFQRRPQWPVGHSAALPAESIYRIRGSFDLLSREIKTRIHDRGERVKGGWYEAFGHEWRRFPSTVIGWSTVPSGGFTFPAGPWWTVPHLPPQADIKEVWEPARFGWVYDLVRAHHLDNNPQYGAAFYRRLREWFEASPPYDGVHWSCGQETAIRAIAILHGETGLSPDPANAERDRRLVTQVLASSGERIESAIGYGLSQRNNHGISESAGLVHIGLRLAGVHPRATKWVAQGRRLLDEQIQDQFLEDGWYSQHSFFYMRVALQQALLAQRALLATGQSLAAASIGRLGAALDLIVTVIDSETGQVPNYGANDGSRVLPLSSAAYRDFRPLLTLGSLVLRRPMPAEIPLDGEVVAWIGEEPLTPGPARGEGVYRGESSGWIVVRHHAIVAFLRAGILRHRPSHLDLLHLNLSIDGREVIIDPGTYAYNAPAPWKNALATAKVHNAPVLDDTEPASKGPRFFWKAWPSARVVSVARQPSGVRVVAEVPDRVRREVEVRSDEVLVTDTVLDSQVRSIQVTWLVHPEMPSGDVVHAERATEVVARADASDAWFSPSYLQRVPARGVRVRAERTNGADPLQLRASIVSPFRGVGRL